MNAMKSDDIKAIAQFPTVEKLGADPATFTKLALVKTLRTKWNPRPEIKNACDYFFLKRLGTQDLLAKLSSTETLKEYGIEFKAIFQGEAFSTLLSDLDHKEEFWLSYRSMSFAEGAQSFVLIQKVRK